MLDSPSSPPGRLTRTQWLICIVAAMGFAFDIYELLMTPLIAGPALAELLGVPQRSEVVTQWTGYIFWGSAFSGGVFGLLGGYLTDRFGRRRVLVWSILLYAFSAFAAGFSTSAAMLLILRCTTFIGVCVEFVAAVAWLAELFPEPRRREAVLGYTQAFSSVGGLLVTGANFLAIAWAQSLPAIHGGHSAWRYTLISGVIPAIPLIIIRPFLPESPAWREKREKGTLRRPSVAELFQPAYLRTTIVTTILFACAYGAAFGAIQLGPPRIVPGLPEVVRAREEGEKLAKEAESLKVQLAALLPSPAPEPPPPGKTIEELGKESQAALKKAQRATPDAQIIQEVGGLLGRFVLAYLAVRILSRRKLLRIFQVPGLILIPLIFLYAAQLDLQLFKWGLAVAGFFTIAQFSFWGNYLPRVYPVHLRGTGEGFAANVGGRMIGTSAAFLTTNILAPIMPGTTQSEKVAYGAAIVVFAVYAIGLAASFWLPEPPARDTQE